MDTQHMKGVDKRGDPRICMIVGCARKALYRSPFNRKEAGVSRGYYSAHRNHAMSGVTSFRTQRSTEWFMRSVD